VSVPAASGGNRLRWAQLPAELRAAVEDHFGAAVVRADSQPGGFSPGLASRLELADGQRVFAKAVSARRNPYSTAAHRREAGVLAALPAGVPAPGWSYSGKSATGPCWSPATSTDGCRSCPGDLRSSLVSCWRWKIWPDG
jgi:hypothetical protein